MRLVSVIIRKYMYHYINNIFLKGWQYIVTQEVIVNWDEADVHNV